MSVEILDRLDSLEGWVAIKEDPFNDPVPPPRLTFLVSWNDVERKVAVTCRLRSRVMSDSMEYHGRSGLFTFQEIQGIHEMLCLVEPSLSPHLPELPEEPRGLWSFMSSPETPRDVDTVCRLLEDYFPYSLEICKEKLLMSTLFEEHSPDDYFESISEIKKQLLDQAINIAHDKLNNVLFLRSNSSNMHDMREVYQLEDEAVNKLTSALSEMYNYQLQPFLDLRELAYSKVRKAKQQLQNPNIGERVKKEYAAKFTDWQGHYEEALDSIQELYVKYYSQTCDIYEGMLIRINEDQTNYGRTAFEMIGGERLLRIQEELSSEKIQLLQNIRKQYVQERDKVKEEIASVDEGPGTSKLLENLEAQAFDWQLKVYKVQMQVLDEEEKMAKSQLHMITQQIQDEEERIVFYDAVEDFTEISSDEESQSRIITDPQLRLIRNKLISIHRKRAKIRNLKAAWERQFFGKEEQKMEDILRWKQHHSIQTKRDVKKGDEVRKTDFIQEERKKTIERLKTFKVKHPAPAAIKPPRYQPPSQRRGTKMQDKAQTDTVKGKTKLGEARPVVTNDSQANRKSSPQPRCSKIRQSDDLPVTIYVKGGVLESDTVSPPPPPPPPPPPIPLCPPPPPPPLPSTSGTTNFLKTEKGTTGKQQDIISNKGVVIQSGTPELGAILSSRQKLKPVSEKEKLKKAANKDPMDEVLDMIKNGVKLRCIKKYNRQEEEKESPLITPSDQHLKLLQESLNRINRFTRDSSPDSDSDQDFDD